MNTVNVNKIKHNISEVFQSSEDANVYRTDSGIVKEFVANKKRHLNSFKRELFWLQHFNDTDITPKLIDYDKENLTILMEDCGEPINKINFPNDWEKQLARILSILKKNNCRHNDLSDEEILVKNNKIKIIDFSISSLGMDMTCGGFCDQKTKKRIFSDQYITNFVELKLFPGDGSSELHNFILWDTSEEELVEKKIGQKFKIIQKISYDLSTIKQIGPSRLEFLYKIYHGRVSKHGDKAKKPFTLFVVIDNEPKYEQRSNVFTGKKSIVNVNMFDVLQILRKGRNSYLHGSDSIQESYDNLETLTFYNKQVPLLYWHLWRPRFESIKEFFDCLNNNKDLKYIVMRNFDDLLGGIIPKANSDIDLLVNDFYLFKRITGAIGYKHKQKASYINGGTAKEYGGYKVGAHILIGGERVNVDIRYKGDNYYCINWQEELLETARVKNGVKIPSKENYFFSLLYHALVHKYAVNDEYRSILSELAKSHATNSSGQMLANEDLWTLLNEFMNEKKYTYVRALEHSIPFNARILTDINPKDDLLLVKKRIKSYKFREARHLINQLRNDYPIHLKYIFYHYKIKIIFFINMLAGGNLKLRKMIIKEKFTKQNSN